MAASFYTTAPPEAMGMEALMTTTQSGVGLPSRGAGLATAPTWDPSGLHTIQEPPSAGAHLATAPTWDPSALHTIQEPQYTGAPLAAAPTWDPSALHTIQEPELSPAISTAPNMIPAPPAAISQTPWWESKASHGMPQILETGPPITTPVLTVAPQAIPAAPASYQQMSTPIQTQCAVPSNAAPMPFTPAPLHQPMQQSTMPASNGPALMPPITPAAQPMQASSIQQPSQIHRSNVPTSRYPSAVPSVVPCASPVQTPTAQKPAAYVQPSSVTPARPTAKPSSFFPAPKPAPGPSPAPAPAPTPSPAPTPKSRSSYPPYSAPQTNRPWAFTTPAASMQPSKSANSCSSSYHPSFVPPAKAISAPTTPYKPSAVSAPRKSQASSAPCPACAAASAQVQRPPDSYRGRSEVRSASALSQQFTASNAASAYCNASKYNAMPQASGSPSSAYGFTAPPSQQFQPYAACPIQSQARPASYAAPPGLNAVSRKGARAFSCSLPGAHNQAHLAQPAHPAQSSASYPGSLRAGISSLKQRPAQSGLPSSQATSKQYAQFGFPGPASSYTHSPKYSPSQSQSPMGMASPKKSYTGMPLRAPSPPTARHKAVSVPPAGGRSSGRRLTYPGFPQAAPAAAPAIASAQGFAGKGHSPCPFGTFLR